MAIICERPEFSVLPSWCFFGDKAIQARPKILVPVVAGAKVQNFDEIWSFLVAVANANAPNFDEIWSF